MYSQGALQGNPAKSAQALIVLMAPSTFLPKTFLFELWPRLDQVRVGGAGESPALLFGAFQGRERGLSPTSFCRHTHQDTQSNSHKHTKR